MKNILLLFLFLFSIGLYAQNSSSASELKTEGAGKFFSALQHISVNASLGTGYYRTDLKSLRHLSLGELSVHVKTGSRLSLGVGSIGALLCDRTVLDAEGNPVELDDDGPDDDDEGEPEDEDDANEAEDDGCEDDFELGDNIVGLFSYQLSENLPLFVRAGAGYSFTTNAPVYTVFVGYNQEIFANLGLTAGFRYSDILKTGQTPNFVSSIGGVKAELGVSWNF